MTENPTSTLAAFQLDDLTQAQRAIRDHFQQGGSILSVFMVLIVIAAIVALAYWLSQHTAHFDGTAKRNDPVKLFFDLMRRMNFSQEQQKTLEKIVREQEVKNPAVILLCPNLFDRYVGRWEEQQPQSNASRKNHVRRQLLKETRQRLFPHH